MATSRLPSIFLSYNWAHKEIVTKIKDQLKSKDFKVWIDTEHLKGCLLEAMSAGIDGADVFIMAVSEKYKESEKCRLEAKYARKRGKPIIPIMVQKGYDADGWLGMFLEDMLYFIFYDESIFQDNFDNLLKGIMGTGVHNLHEITSKQSPKKQQISDVLAPPGRPEFLEISSRKLSVRWEPPKKSTNSVSKYLVFDAEENLMAEVKGDKTEAEVSIFPNIEYQFTVQAEWGNGEISVHSEPSDTFEKKMSQDEIRIANIKDQSKCITEPRETPKVYLLDMKKIGGDKNIQKLEFGTKKWNVPEKVVMLLGATGSGKTNLINGMANFILGIKWDDDFRIKLVSEEKLDQTQSQTKHITSYTIHPQKESRIPFSLTMVDTPGFEDTKGLERDHEIMDQIKEFFSTSGDLGFDHVDGIGLVVQSSLTRLSQIQKSIFDSILSLFGKDVAENIFPLLTFADAETPQVLNTLRTAEIPYDLYFKFNNSALYVDRSKKTNFNKMFWDMGEENFGHFFNSLPEVKAKSLKLTKEVLEERNKLEAQIEGIRHDIEVGLHKMEELDCEWAAIQQHHALEVKYQNAQDEKLKHEQIIQSIASDINQTRVTLTEKVLEVKKCVTCLQKIALKPSSPSTVEYVEQMIDEEKLTQESGWKKRVKQLEGVKKTAQFVDNLTKDDPYSNFSDTLDPV